MNEYIYDNPDDKESDSSSSSGYGRIIFAAGVVIYAVTDGAIKSNRKSKHRELDEIIGEADKLPFELAEEVYREAGLEEEVITLKKIGKQYGSMLDDAYETYQGAKNVEDKSKASKMYNGIVEKMLGR